MTRPGAHPRRHTVLAFLAGALTVIVILVAVYFGVRALDTGGRLPRRQAKTADDLAATLAADAKVAADENRRDVALEVEALHARQQSDPGATLDFLLLSGGGDRGAFGAGFLLGWASIAPGANALPKFDGVSGVSAGSFIAPFAFLGSHADYETIDHLFRDPQPDWVVRRGLFFFLPENSSLAGIPGLERALRAQMGLAFAERIVQAGDAGRRVLIIQATDMDTGGARDFDAVAAAREAVTAGDPKIFSDLMLASSAIPGAFPPREIDGRLYADGGIASNFYYGGPVALADTFGETWKRTYPGAPVPKTRYWVIINEYIEPVPVTVQPTWPEIVARSIYVSVRSAEAIALRHLFAIADATKLRGDGDVEVRWVAVPQSWKPLTDDPFDGATMRQLSDVGRRLGADPSSWMTEAP